MAARPRPATSGPRLTGALTSVVIGVVASTLACRPLHASPAQDYMLHCMGCHGTEAQGIPGKVPPLANALTRFMRTPAGRDYILRVPGAANSALSNDQLAAVLNWLAVTFDRHSSHDGSQTGDIPMAPAPFTAAEIARVRHTPLVAVLATRNAVVRDLAKSGPAPPPQY
jgi:hypothetical protein